VENVDAKMPVVEELPNIADAGKVTIAIPVDSNSDYHEFAKTMLPDHKNISIPDEIQLSSKNSSQRSFGGTKKTAMVPEYVVYCKQCNAQRIDITITAECWQLWKDYEATGKGLLKTPFMWGFY
jgi:hypothetical protein